MRRIILSRIVRTLLVWAAVVAPSTAGATDYIKDVKLIGGSLVEVLSLKSSLIADGWICVEKNLNANAGGDIIYLLYKTESNDEGVNMQYITDFYISDSGGTASSTQTFSGRTYHLVSYDGGDHFKKMQGNLNSGTGSGTTNIHLYYTRDLFSDNRVVTSVSFSSMPFGSVVWNGNGSAADLNKGCGSSSDDIYMHLATSTAVAGHSPVVTIDACLGGNCEVVVSGWCYDPDAPSKSLKVRIYVYQGSFSSAPYQEVMADQPREDVNDVFHITGEHGFSTFVSIETPGKYLVKVVAVDYNGDESTLLDPGDVTVTDNKAVVTIGDGRLAQPHLPVMMYKNYSLSQQIYTAEEIGMGGTIKDIAFQYAYTKAFTIDKVKIYLKHTAKSVFDSRDDMVPVTEDDKVYEGPFSATGAGWVTIPLDTPFEYDGSNNLMVCFFDPTSGHPGSDDYNNKFRFYLNQPQRFCTIVHHDNSAVPTLDGNNFTGNKEGLYGMRNNLRMTIVFNNYFKPVDLVDCSNPDHSVTLSWTAPESNNTITGYTYQYKKESETAWSDPVSVPASTTSVTLTGLDLSAAYQFRVNALYGSHASGWSSVRFTSITKDLPYEQGFENGMDDWRMVDCSTGYTGISAEARRYGESGFLFRTNGTGTEKPQYLISPVIAGESEKTVSFYYKDDQPSLHDRFQVGYSTKTDNLSDFIWGDEISGQNAQWVLYEQKFPANARYFAVKYLTNRVKLYLDDFSFVAYSSLTKPLHLAASQLTDHSAMLSWSTPAATGYSYQFKKLDETAWSTPVEVDKAFITLDGLSPNTTYDFRVKALYGNDASYYASIRFLTEASAVNVPFTEGFENGMGGWRIGNDFGETGISATNPEYIRSGDHSFEFDLDEQCAYHYLFSPELNCNSSFTVTFYHKNATDGGNSYPAKFQVGNSSTTKDPDAFRWTDVVSSTHEWLLFIVHYSANTKYVAVRWVEGAWLYLDDFSFSYSYPSLSAARKASILGEEKYMVSFYDETASYQLPEGMAAYTVTLDGDDLVFLRIGDGDSRVIPIGTPVVILADKDPSDTADSISIPLSFWSNDVDAPRSNILQAVSTPMAVTNGKIDGKAVYVLGVKDGIPGFYQFDGETLPARKAFILK